MYASFLLKYSKSYLHTCIIFILFYFTFFQCHARGRVTSLLHFERNLRISPLMPYSSFLLSLSLFLSSFFRHFCLQPFLPFAHFIRHRSPMMNTVRYDSAIMERKGKRKQRKEEKKYLAEKLTRPAFECLYVYMYVRVCIYMFLCECEDVYKFNTIVVSFTFAYIYIYIYIYI